MCLRGCLCVFVSLPHRTRTLLGIGGSGSHPWPAAPTPGPLRAASPPPAHPWGWILENSSIPLPAQGPGLCRPPSLCGGGGSGVGGEGGRVTLQVSRRVQIFLVSGFSTPHCLLRSHSFPAGRAVPVSLKGISRGASGEEPPAPQCKAAAAGATSPHQQLSAAPTPPGPVRSPGTPYGDSKPQAATDIWVPGVWLWEAPGAGSRGDKAVSSPR